jgi:hypothetical protein
MMMMVGGGGLVQLEMLCWCGRQDEWWVMQRDDGAMMA